MSPRDKADIESASNSRRTELLRAFHGANGRLLSGELLASRLGVSRASLWKHVHELQRLGVPIRSQTRAGYAWNGVADLSLTDWTGPEWISPHYAIVDSSTQNSAKDAAERDAAEGNLWMCEIQTAGRGRLGRSWDAAFGGLWFSLILRPTLAPAQVAPISLLAGIALTETARAWTGAELFVKWPNDVIVRQKGRWKKVAGILTEMSGEMERTRWIVLGIGINIHNRLPAALSTAAQNLDSVVRDRSTIERGAFLSEFLKRFRTLYIGFVRTGFEAFQPRYWKLFYKPRESIRLQTAQGVVEGTAVGVDAQGALIVKSRRQTQHLSEGEITL